MQGESQVSFWPGPPPCFPWAPLCHSCSHSLYPATPLLGCSLKMPTASDLCPRLFPLTGTLFSRQGHGCFLIYCRSQFRYQLVKGVLPDQSTQNSSPQPLSSPLPCLVLSSQHRPPDVHVFLPSPRMPVRCTWEACSLQSPQSLEWCLLHSRWSNIC